MFHASKFVGIMESDDDDYVSMSEEEMEQGIQTVSNLVSAPQPQQQQQQQLPQLQPQPQGVTLMGGMFDDMDMRDHNVSESSSEDEEVEEERSRSIRRPQRKKKEKRRRRRSISPPRQKEKEKKSGFLSSLFSFGGSSNTSRAPQRQSSPVYQENNNNDDGWSWGGNKVGQQMHESRVKEQVSSIQSVLDNNSRRNKSKKKHKKRKRMARKKINTNVVAVDLATLGDEALLATGDPYKCENEKCQSILASSDKLLTTDGDFKCDDDEVIWNCRFCGTRNIIDIEDEEKPKGETIDYVISPPSDEKSEEESLVVFCVDTSGSMCVTQAVDGKFELKGKEDLSTIRAFNEDRSNQFLPNQRKNVTYVSRLQSVQASIDDQLTTLAKEKPKAKVALVTFSNEVVIHGDGKQTAEFIAGDKLKNENLLKEIGSSYRIENNIEDSRENLSKKLYTLREDGQTALGPALVVSIALASQKSGSVVILCTDGLANIGVGNMDDLSEEEEDTCTEWYENLGNVALNSGVTVNVISITDSETKLENLGKVTDASQGTVERINPLELQSNFKGILTKKVVATKCSATMIIHPVLKFRKDDDDEVDVNKEKVEEEVKPIPRMKKVQLSMVQEEDFLNLDENDDKDKDKDKETNEGDDDKDVVMEDKEKETKEEPEPESKEEPREILEVARQTQDVGNVFEDSKIYFEYAIKRELLKEKYKDLKAFTFQVQISFFRSDGSQMMRVISQEKEVTRDRKELLKSLNMGIMAANASRKTGRMIEEGDYESARAYTYMNSVWMSNNLQNQQQMNAMNNYISSNLTVDSVVQQQQQQERMSNMSYSGVNKSKRKKARSKQRGDHFSKTMYYSKKM